jgi:hypothetical protein
VVTRRPTVRGICAAALLLGCAAAVVGRKISEVGAQDVQLRPQAGLYLPTSVAVQNGTLQVRQRIGMTVGARLTVTFNQRFEVATGVTYIPGYAAFRGAGKLIHVATSAHLFAATTGARYWLLQPTRKLSWEVHTGLGVALGGQPAYEDLFENSTVGGILGTTVHYQIGRMVRLQLRIQDRVSRVRLGGRDPGSSGPPLHISFGLTLPFLDSARAVAS